MLALEPWMASHAEGRARSTFHADLAVTLDNADRHAEAQRFHRLAIDAATALRAYDELMVIHGNLAASLSCSGRLDASIEHALTSERLRAMNRETTPKASMTPGTLMRMLREAGRYAEAMRWAELARAEFESQLPGWLAVQLAQEAWLWIHLGQLPRARAALRRARECEVGAAWIPAALTYREGQLERASGRDPRALFEAALAQFSVEGRRITRAAIELDLASVIEPAAGRKIALAVLRESEARGQAGMALAARIRAVQCTLDAGSTDEAATLARTALAGSADVPTDDVYRGELWWQAYRALAAAGARDEADAARQQGVQWLQRIAREELPAAMREAFLEGNPVNRQLRRAA
jgi:hypothetical protein